MQVSTSSTRISGEFTSASLDSQNSNGRLFNRSGLYPVPSFPAAIGKEIAGTIVALPTDPEVLNNETFKSHGYKVGGKVGAVR